MSESTLGQVLTTGAEMPKLTAIIPTGGGGGGMYPMTAAMPKTLLPVHDRPILVHILGCLDPAVFKRAIILCDVWSGMLKHYLQAFRKLGDIPVPFDCVKRDREEKPPAALIDMLGKLTDPFVLYYCDILLPSIDWQDVRRQYFKRKEEDNILAMLIVSRKLKHPVGVVRMEGGSIAEFDQKPTEMLAAGYFANCAVALLSKKFVTTQVDPSHTDIFDHSLKKVLHTEKVAGYEIEKWDHLQTHGDWLNAQVDHYAHLRS